MPARIAIIGAGISGLSLGYALAKQGCDITVFEACERPGGPIQTLDIDGYRVETGPHTLLVRHREVADLLADLDLDDEAVEANDAASTRYIVRNGTPIALPSSPMEAATTPLISAWGRLRMLAEPLIPRRGDDGIDETLAQFVTRRLGLEAMEYLVDPFVGGIWAGDPHSLSARHTFPPLVEFEKSGGSITVGALRQKLSASDTASDRVPRRLISFRAGMNTLVQRLAQRLGDSLRLDTPVRKLRLDDDGWRVIFEIGKARRGQTFDALVSTIPAYALDNLEWENISPPATSIDSLSHMPYAPCSVLSLGYRRDQVDHPLDGFGCLIPRVESFNILGALFISTMFADRAPPGQVLLSAFVGGARQPELTRRDDQSLVDLAHHDLQRLLGIDGQPTFSHITRWRRAIPQYEVGHQVYLNHIDRIEDSLPHFFLTGNYRDHVGIPNIIEEAAAHSQRIQSQLN